MKLSIVIVNYNVKFFLEQCLHSVFNAIEGIEAEVFVVDNQSVDGSCRLVKEKFPRVILIENKENLGFSKANNQAIQLARGEYILLLNPDTVVQEDTFTQCLDFIESHPDAGALGVKLIDGKGNFLPESKRALPTPKVAFYKIFGLSAMFPKSREFGKYHLSYLDENETHEVDVLVGAFMFMRKTALDKSGLLDEQFFMYGEDIDLSYRIQLSGYKNYYYPGTTIIHYKGESTKKGSLNYVFIFYQAMIIFARKHFSSRSAGLFSFFIHLAIYLRAGISLLKRGMSTITLPLIDAGLIYIGFYLITPLWGKYIFGVEGYFPDWIMHVVYPVIIGIWFISIFLHGGYSKNARLAALYKGVLVGLVCILIVYALIPEHYRFSRALILLGAAWALISITLSRLVIHLLGLPGSKMFLNTRKKVVILGNATEVSRVRTLLESTRSQIDIVGFVSVGENDSDALGSVGQIEEITRVHGIDEVIFCASDIPSGEIIKLMLLLGQKNLEYKIAPPESISIIGSSSINTAGELYVMTVNAVTSDVNRKKKRLLDLIVSLVYILGFPVLWIIIRAPVRRLKDAVNVLLGKYTWVGFKYLNDGFYTSLEGVFTPADGLGRVEFSPSVIERLNLMYAKDYRVSNDLSIILRNFLWFIN